MVVFLIGSALSGTSQTMGQLVIYRGIQGLFTAVFGISAIVGPLIGGAITDHWGWRWVFYVNMPVGVVALVAAGLTLSGLTKRVLHKIDYLGTGLLVIWATSLLLAFSLGGSIGVAVIGAIVTNVYTSKLASSVPAPLKPYVNTSQLSNLNGSGQAVNVAGATARLGPETKLLLGQLAMNVKESFVSSVTLSFTIGMIMMIAAMVVALFLREIPLRGREGAGSAPASSETTESGDADELETIPELVL